MRKFLVKMSGENARIITEYFFSKNGITTDAITRALVDEINDNDYCSEVVDESDIKVTEITDSCNTIEGAKT